MKKTNVMRFVQSTLIVLLSAGIIGGNSMIAYAQNASAEEAVVEEVAVTEAEVVAETENVEVVSELEAVEVEETLAATEAIGGTWGTVDWSISNGTLTFEVTDGKTYGKILEPDSGASNYSTESVREMVAADYPWAAYKDSVTKIVVGGNISEISEVAFYGMTKVQEIELGSYLYYIRDYAFANCTSLKEITLPAKLTDSGFGKGVFYNCTSLEEAKGNIILNAYTFYGCTSLKSITIPNTDDIGSYALYGCSSLKEITIPDNIGIYNYAFANCTGLTSVTIPSTLEYPYGDYAFSGCTGLKEVNVESYRVGEYMFKDCTGLVKVNFPTEETCKVSTGSFYNCTSLSEITGKGSNYQYSYYNCKSLTSCDNLIEGADEIQNQAFYGCTGLKEVTISGQDSINYRAFYGCSGLEKVVFESSTTIYNEAFAKCDIKEFRLDKLDKIYFWNNVLAENESCKVYGKLDSLSENLAEDNNCTFVPTDKLPQTTMSTLSSASNGIRVTWAEGEYALKYDVYRCTLEGGNYTLIKSGVTGTEYIDTNVTPGVKYYYKVVSVGELAKSELSEASTAGMYLAAPTFKKIVNVVSGVHVYWNAADGAKTYSVYRSTSKTGDYTLVKSGLTATHYIDTTAVSGKTYYYKVLAVNGSFSTSSYVEPFKPYTYVGTPDITSRINKAAGVELGWNKIEGATGYAIYRKPYVGGSWARITTIEGNRTFTYTDEAVRGNNGTIYRYTVRALAGSDMKTLSGCRNTGRTMVRLSSRTLNSAVKTSATSIKCNWSTSAAVTGYEVRFMIGNTVYKTFTVGNYKTGAKTFKGLPSGYNYKVQVRAYKKVDGVGSFYSAWSTPKYVQL